MKKVFLGGTCNHSMWRDELISQLNIDYFNPVTEDWTPERQVEEQLQRENCDFCLYVITPKMTGVYSIAEVADDSNKRPEKTVFAYIERDGDQHFTVEQLKSLEAVCALVENNGGQVFRNLRDVAHYLNAFG